MPRYAMPSKVSTFGAGRALLIDYRLKHRGPSRDSSSSCLLRAACCLLRAACCFL